MFTTMIGEPRGLCHQTVAATRPWCARTSRDADADPRTVEASGAGIGDFGERRGDRGVARNRWWSPALRCDLHLQHLAPVESPPINAGGGSTGSTVITSQQGGRE